MNARKRKAGFSALLIIAIVAVIAVAAGVGWISAKKMKSTTLVPPALTPSVTSTITNLTTGNSDSALDKDSEDISTKLNALNHDSVSIDQGLNDQQGNLSEQ